MGLRAHSLCCARYSFSRCCLFLLAGCLCLALVACGAGMPGSSTAPAPSPTPTPPSPPSNAPTITAPAAGASVQSPVLFTGSVASTPNADHSRLLLDGTSIFYGGILPMKNKWMFIPNGQHTLTLTAYDKSDSPVGSTSINIDISGQISPAPMSKLQDTPAWQSCTQDLSGTVCASGLGQATTSQTQNLSTPSLSGASTEYSLGGKTGYSNALWWISLGGGTQLNTFTYDLDFYIDNADATEALEFDVNQSYGGTRFTWGTECSFKNTHFWDVWNPLTEAWVPTTVPCNPVTSNQWHHLTWQFNKVNDEVHYISITLDGVTSPVNMSFPPQPNWNQEDIDIAFQMDGNYNQTPYNVWLDNVTLSASY